MLTYTLMPNEANKALHRLKGLLVGRGLDIGCGNTPITDTCDKWDKEQGDAQHLADIPHEAYDWIFSSHLLEHVRNPTAAIARWWKALKIGGYMILLVPDEDLYEQRVWPSKWNGEHKVTFTTSKENSWSPVSINVTDMLHALPGHKLISLTIEDTGYDYTLSGIDQTNSCGAEASIQVIIAKEKPPMATAREADIQEVHFRNA